MPSGPDARHLASAHSRLTSSSAIHAVARVLYARVRAADAVERVILVLPHNDWNS
jgi:hypothetical protein